MNRRRHLNDRRPAEPAGAAATRRAVLRHLPLASAISAVLAGAPAAYAQQKADAGGGLEEVVVTAQKKSERMQDVPVAIVALGTEKLEELHITNLDDYVKYLPSVAYSRGQGQGGNGQPGSSHVYMRGVVSGANENHSGSQPSVGTYIDEQPVTTIDGTPDLHVYDIARVEVLEGPQGTLFGSSSQAGTIRIITNKPDPAKFSAGYDLAINDVAHDGIGYVAEGFINIPLSPIAAVRLVAWDEHDAGFINNVAGTNLAAGIQNGIRTFPTWCSYNDCTPYSPGSVGAGSISNAPWVKNRYNTVDIKGGRGALKLDLGENWTVTPSVMGQSTNSEGFFGYDPAVGDLSVTHFSPENSQDSWVQGALTIEGKIHDFDLVYAGAYMKRNTHSIADYADYSFFYDQLYGSGAIWRGNSPDPNNPTGGAPIMPQEIVISKGYFEKFSHELRLSTPQQYPVKGTIGVFVQRQLHDIFEQYAMPGLGYSFNNSPYGDHNPLGFADYLSIPTLPNTIWLTDEQRVDRDQAAFAQVTWDMTAKLSGTVGYRYFKTDNTLQGFYGYSANYNALSGYSSGMDKCFGPPTVNGIPCTDLDKRVADSGHVPRVNLTYKITPDKMIYATYSEGFRPGGVNRTAAAGIGPYQADYLKNYEVGWKTQWLNHHLRWNGSVFWEDWNDFQFSFLGPNSVTIIQNGGNARIKGVESELEWAVGGGFTWSVNATLLQSRLQDNYCGVTDGAGKVVTTPNCTYTDASGNPAGGFTPLAPAGADMPIAPKFKANTVLRYAFSLGNDWDANVQAAVVYQTETAPALKTADQQVIGMQPAYYLADLSAGVEKGNMSWKFTVTNVTDQRAEISRFVSCTVGTCLQPYVIPAQPRTFSIGFGQKF
ncbi:MAG: TonB-dependent receptor [Proteobacteria bacterium]|nr:TonB-dependent receptor [Pseudomonadota bacterium]